MKCNLLYKAIHSLTLIDSGLIANLGSVTRGSYLSEVISLLTIVRSWEIVFSATFDWVLVNCGWVVVASKSRVLFEWWVRSWLFWQLSEFLMKLDGVLKFMLATTIKVSSRKFVGQLKINTGILGLLHVFICDSAQKESLDACWFDFQYYIQKQYCFVILFKPYVATGTLYIAFLHTDEDLGQVLLQIQWRRLISIEAGKCILNFLKTLEVASPLLVNVLSFL